MNTNIVCPTCRRGLSVPPEALGKTGRCPFCSSQFKLTTVATPVAPAPPIPATSSQDAELAAFLSSSQTSAPSVRQPARPRQQRRKPLTGPIVIAVSFLLVASVFAIWAFNAARAVSQFTQSISASASDDNGVTLAKFDQIQPGMSYQQVVQILGAERQLMSQNQLDSPRY